MVAIDVVRVTSESESAFLIVGADLELVWMVGGNLIWQANKAAEILANSWGGEGSEPLGWAGAAASDFFFARVGAALIT